MKVIPFKREHLRNMILQQRQRGMELLLNDELYAVMENPASFTGIDGDEVLVCAGVLEVAPGRGQAWAYVSDNVGSRMTEITYAARRYFQIAPYRRIEADVDCNFEAAHRWVRLLGFEMEAPRRKSFTPDGRDCALYARVRNA